MLISTQHRKVVLNVNNPDKITTIIPTAKLLEFKGKTLVVVPHKDEETRVLRNLGYEVPAPIQHYYDWPGRFPPYIHQRETAAFLSGYPRSLCLNGMGSGKTISVLWAFDYLRRIGIARRMLVVAPLSTLERTWGDEVFNNFPELTACVLHGTEAKRLKLIATDFDVYIINHDGIKNKRVLEALIKRTDIDLIVPDEIASFRNASTDRWKSLNKLTKTRQFVWGLTGTPTPTAPTDVWAIVRLISPSKITGSFTAFRDKVMRKSGPYKWVARDDAVRVVSEVMQPSIRFSREDCIDLPPTTYLTRHAAMTEEQETMYKSMFAKLCAEYAEGKIMAVNKAVKAGKLLQIASGAVYNANHEAVFIPSAPRMEVTLELIQESDSKVIVFVPFTGALTAVTEYLRKKGYSVENIHGQTSKAERDRIFSAFQKTALPQILVANPGAMAHGLTLTAASTIIWFAPPMSNETYEQANARIVRPGQKFNTRIAHIEGSLIERKAYERLQHRGEMQDLLLETLKDGGGLP